MNKFSKQVARGFIFLALLAVAAPVLAQRPICINLGTTAPEGSPWHELLQQMGQDWNGASKGTVTVRIYPGGVLGDEAEMLRKARIGQLHAVGLSGSGLAITERSVLCFHIPLMIESYEELDYLRDRMAPKIEALLLAKGLVVLNWSDVGWVHFFTKTPARSPDEIRKMKLFTSAGDPETEALYKEFRFQPVPLSVNDLLPSLQTGMIEAIDVPPLFALLDQSFGLAKNMLPVKWTSLVGATVVNKSTWERIPEPLRSELMKIARDSGNKFRDRIRKLGDEAIVEMQKRGLNVMPLDEPTLTRWRTESAAAYPKLRGHYVPADLFDETLRLRDEFRRTHPLTPGK